MKNFLFLSLLTFTLFASGCGSDDDGIIGPAFCTDLAFSEALSNAVSNLNDAATLFADDPSTANCEAYRAAAQDYVDEISRFEDCATFGTRDDFRDALRDAEESVAMIAC